MSDGELALVNLTPFRVESAALDGVPEHEQVVIVKATFDLVVGECARVSGEQLPLAGADLHEGDPELTPIRYESDFVPRKLRADVLVSGKAHAPGGKPVAECRISFAVGALTKSLRVIGDRTWRPILGRFLSFKSRPEPFQSMDISYANAFGGKNGGKPDGLRSFAGNRIGKGYSRFGGGLKGLRLPNLEDPKRAIRTWWSRPSAASFGPVGREWQPRAKLAGRFDKRWLAERSPLLPVDFDESFYNAAPADQQVDGYLRGDEEIRVQNMHPAHADFRARLPGMRVRAFVADVAADRIELAELAMHLDTLWIDMESLQLVLVWRGRAPACAAAPSSRLVVGVEPITATPSASTENYQRELAVILEAELRVDAEVEEAERELAGICAA
ncbi:MAG: DUF2169 domain-containing protein [Planctomycetota bacterium]